MAARALLSVALVAVLAGPAGGGPHRDASAVPSSPPASVSRRNATAHLPVASTVAIGAGGVRRTATVVLPPQGRRTAGRRLPVLLVLHGVGGRGGDLRSLGFEERALRRGVAVVYPDGWRARWNDGRPGIDHEPPADVQDDVAFVRALVAELGARAGVDTGRVAVAGFSNGALMAGRLACDASDALVAVGLVAGTIGEGLLSGCRPARPVPIALVSGDADAIVPYAGGQIADFNGRRRGRVTSAGDFLAFWAGAHGCGHPVTSSLAGTSPPVVRFEAPDCRTGGTVVHHRISGGGHDWHRTGGFDTTAAIWQAVAPSLGVG